MLIPLFIHCLLECLQLPHGYLKLILLFICHPLLSTLGYPVLGRFDLACYDPGLQLWCFLTYYHLCGALPRSGIGPQLRPIDILPECLQLLLRHGLDNVRPHSLSLNIVFNTLWADASSLGFVSLLHHLWDLLLEYLSLIFLPLPLLQVIILSYLGPYGYWLGQLGLSSELHQA